MINIDILEDEIFEQPGCTNGAYIGNTSWDGERYADQMIADERRWRENIRKGINDIKALRVAWENSKKFGHKHKMRMLEEDIIKRKEEVKELILSRNYEWRE